MAPLTPSAVVFRSLRRQALRSQSIFNRRFCAKPSVRSRVSTQVSFHVHRPTRTFATVHEDDISPQISQTSSIPNLTSIPITVDQYHAHTNIFFDKLVTVLEEAYEEREDVDIEYSVCSPKILQNNSTDGLIRGLEWRAHAHFPAAWDLCHQQAAPKPPNLAELSCQRAEKIRFGWRKSRQNMGVPQGWHDLARFVGEGATGGD